MAIPIGKLALYTAACGIHPALTLPVSLDVGTDNPALLADPLYLGYRAPRLRGAEPTTRWSRPSSTGVAEVWPGCVIQWEDFKQANALRILDRYRDRVPSFNDDIQGTAAVVVAGVLAGLRGLGTTLRRDARRARRSGRGGDRHRPARCGLRCSTTGWTRPPCAEALVLVDSHGLVHDGRDGSRRHEARAGDAGRGVRGIRLHDRVPGLVETIVRVRPTVLVGTTGVGGTFDEAVLRAMAARHRSDRSSCRSRTRLGPRGDPGRLLRWTDGRAIVATGSPFDAVDVDGSATRGRPGEQCLRLPRHRTRRDRGRGKLDHGPDVPARCPDAGGRA